MTAARRALVAFASIVAVVAGAAPAVPAVVAPADSAAPPSPGGVSLDLPASAAPRTKVATIVTRGLRDRVAARSDSTGAPAPPVLVEVVHDDAGGAVQDAVAAAGGTVRGSVPGSLVLASVPPAALDALARVSGVRLVREPLSVRVPDTLPAAETWPAAPALGEVKARIGADAWHAAGLRGAGAKVAIIDVFDAGTWDVQVAAGRVPPVPGDRRFCLAYGAPCDVFEGATHGNQVAETFATIAPDAELYLVNVTTNSDLYAAIAWLRDRGVRVLSRSSSAAYDGPGNGTGPSAEVVRAALAADMLWVNSGGNTAAGGYWRGSWADADGDGWLDFEPGRETVRVGNPCSGYLFGLRWSDWSGGATDFDLYAADPTTGVMTLVSGLDQQSGAPPVEGAGSPLCGYTAWDGNVYLAVHRYQGSPGAEGDVLEISGNNLLLQGYQAPFSAAGTFRDVVDPAVLAVGALTNPSSTQVAAYSSRGPLNFGAGTKPDLVAPACVPISLGECIQGTSLSAPVVSAAAALVWGALGSPGGPDRPARWLGTYLRAFAFDRGSPGPDNAYGQGELRLPAPPVIAWPATRFAPLGPTRILDTRPSSRFAAGETRTLRPAVPAGTQAVAVNVTMVDTGGPGWAQVAPTGWSFPGAHSNVNSDTGGRVVPNLAVVPLGADGRIDLHSSVAADYVVDLVGAFVASGASADGRYRALRPFRVLDTRTCTGLPGPCGGAGQWLEAGQPLALRVAGAADPHDPANAVPPGAQVSAVAVNVTVTEAAAPGFLQVVPSGGATPLGATSNLNFVTGTTAANLVLVPVGVDGTITFYASARTHLVVDVLGTFTGPDAPVAVAGLFQPVRPTRLRDTRIVPGAPTASGPPGLAVSPSGVGGVPAGPPGAVAAVLVNATATETAGAGWAQVAPTGQATFGAFSNLNYERPGQTVANAATATLGDAGAFTLFTSVPTHLVVDLMGWFVGSSPG